MLWAAWLLAEPREVYPREFSLSIFAGAKPSLEVWSMVAHPRLFLTNSALPFSPDNASLS